MRRGGRVAALETQQEGFTEISGVVEPNTNSSAANEYVICLDMTAGMYGVT